MNDWRTLYPQQPDKVPAGPRATTPLLAYPQRQSTWIDSARLYWSEHGVEESFLDRVTSVYPTDRGIAFLLIGGGYQERLTTSGQRRFESSMGESRRAVYRPATIDYAPLAGALFLVEGPADALAIREQGYDVVATLGSALTPERVAVIQALNLKQEPIYYMMDSDNAGWSGYDRFTQLYAHGVQPCMLPPGKKDFCCVHRSERTDLLNWWVNA